MEKEIKLKLGIEISDKLLKKHVPKFYEVTKELKFYNKHPISVLELGLEDGTEIIMNSDDIEMKKEMLYEHIWTSIVLLNKLEEKGE